MPNAVGVFADALYGDGTAGSGDKAKLFKDMEKGKVGLKELTKVIEYMGTLTQPDLLAQMLNTPEKKLQRLKTQWILTMEQMNDSGFLDLMNAAFEEFTKLLVDATKWLVENKKEIKLWADRLVSLFRWIMSNLKLLIEVWGLWKIGQWGMGMVSALTAVNGAIAVTRGQLVKTGLIFSGMVLLVGLFTAAIVDLYDTFQGENSIFKALTEDKDKGLLGWLATVARAVFEITASILDMGVNLAAIGWGKVTGNKELQSFAEERAITGGQKLFTHLQDMSLFPSNETLVKNMNPKWVQQEAAKNNGRVTVPFTGAQYQVQPAPVPIQITVNGGSDSSEQVAQMVGFKVQEILTGHYRSAASNYTPLLQGAN